MFSAYHLSDDTASSYIDRIKRSAIQWVHGYPSFVALIAQFAFNRGITLPMKWVTLGAESLLAHQRKVIETVFCVRPVQHYGQAEGVANISEGTDGILYIDEDFSAVEFQHCSDGTRILGTNFTNAAFCLLRYCTGDTAVIGSPKCGRRTVQAIDGRIEDYIVGFSGVRYGRMDHVFKDCASIREAQLRQSEAGRVDVCVVRSEAYDAAAEQQLRRELATRFGNDVAYTLHYVSAIQRTSSGKIRFVVSDVGNHLPGPKSRPG